jgi:DNA-binding NtrC family response regulator
VLVREGLANPTVLFLAKPFTRDELFGLIREALGSARRDAESHEVRRPSDL